VTEYQYAIEWTSAVPDGGSIVVPATLEEARTAARDHVRARAIRRVLGPWEQVPAASVAEGDAAE
jgi:hypothetical protein